MILDVVGILEENLVMLEVCKKRYRGGKWVEYQVSRDYILV